MEVTLWQVVETVGVAVGTWVGVPVVKVEVFWPQLVGFGQCQCHGGFLVDQTTRVSEQVDLTTSWEVVKGQ